MTENDELVEEDAESMDPDDGVAASAWRSWSEHAAPELLEEFDGRTLDCLRRVRSEYPGDCGPRHPQYLDMRRDCVNALNRLSETIQGEFDALD